MSDFAERVKHYDTKCRQHLSRVRLSHMLALGALQLKEVPSDEERDDLIRASLGDEMGDVLETKLRRGLHGLHLVSLKANFELFLNRLLTTVWRFHFTELATTIWSDDRVSLRELAAWFVQVTESGADARDLIIDKTVPVYGLPRFVAALERATHIRLPDVLNREDVRYWPQICTAFEVRHLVEHRDGKVDQQFRTNLLEFWTHSSWGRRESLERLEKVVVEEEDVKETYTAMFKATGLITEEVLRWGSAKAGGQATQVENEAVPPES